MATPTRDSPYSAKDEQKLMADMWDPTLADDLEAFVLYTFPWGKANTPLHDKEGPRSWQRDELQAITQFIRDQRQRIINKQPLLVYQSATSSGRGPGKSALVAWLNLWMLSTRLGSTSINAANSETQLKTRTWAEVGKWHTMAINSHWFDINTMALTPQAWFKESLKKQLKIDTGYYYSQAQLWTEERPDAFAGVHNHNGILVVFDEASGIPKPIWTVTEGFFTEPILDRYWFVFSNPRRNAGPFFECFHKDRAYWRRRNLDSRTVEGTDKIKLQEIVDKNGDDSDEARVEVKGEFPRQGDKQFISRERVQDAISRELVSDHWAPLIMGVDPARFGDDATVIRFRQGRDARSIPPIKLRKKDNMAVANECADLINRLNPDAVCVDVGNGSGVIDRLRELKYKVHEVGFGTSSSEGQWANKRTELWAKMRDWLDGGCIDPDPDLVDDLAGPEYYFQGTSDRIMLEPKEKMKARGLSSPDDADALALTFAVNVARKDIRASRAGTQNKSRRARDVDYNIFGG